MLYLRVEFAMVTVYLVLTGPDLVLEDGHVLLCIQDNTVCRFFCTVQLGKTNIVSFVYRGKRAIKGAYYIYYLFCTKMCANVHGAG